MATLPSYLSLRYESEVEENYISGLVYQFEMARDVGSYHMALFAYHLLFMSYVYQIIHKIKLWMPERFNDAHTQSPIDKRIKYLESGSPWVFSEIRESSIFEFMNLLHVCGGEVKKCKNIIKQRNNGFGHATGVLVSEEEFEKKIEEYDQIAEQLHALTHAELAIIFDEYILNVDKDEEITKDNLELDLIIPNRLSERDLECLSAECLNEITVQKEKIIKIIQEDFNIYMEVAT